MRSSPTMEQLHALKLAAMRGIGRREMKHSRRHLALCLEY